MTGNASLADTKKRRWKIIVPQTFCENSSIRGVPKLWKHKTLCLRFLWVIFLISMSTLLIYGSASLILEYHTHSTLINTQESEEVAEFPSITLCHHHPFSEEAVNFWRNGSILSPKNFSLQLRTAMSHTLKEGHIDEAHHLFFNDKMDTYFETIGHNAASKISHKTSSVRYCLLQLKSTVRVGHQDECGILTKIYPHPTYLNCQIIRVRPEFTKDAVSLGIITELSSEPHYDTYEMGLIQEVFNQAHGIRVTLHEPGSIPDPVKEGINLEAGKFTEMKYETVRWTKAGLPKEECLDAEHLEKLPSYTRQETNFNYTYEACLQEDTAQRLFQKCSCYSAKYPMNDAKRQAGYNYCNKLDINNMEDTLHRLNCFTNFTYAELTRRKSGSKCVERCSYFHYDVHHSTSKWLSTSWQLFWLMRMSDAWEELKTLEKNSKSYNESLEIIQHYLENDNLSQLDHFSNVPKMDNDKNVFFVATRTNFLITEKKETLSLTPNALLSRLGGLSSLSLGVTFSTFFELIEFFCICYRKMKEKPKEEEETIMLNSQSPKAERAAI